MFLRCVLEVTHKTWEVASFPSPSSHTNKLAVVKAAGGICCDQDLSAQRCQQHGNQNLSFTQEAAAMHRHNKQQAFCHPYEVLIAKSHWTSISCIMSWSCRRNKSNIRQNPKANLILYLKFSFPVPFLPVLPITRCNVELKRAISFSRT